MVGKTLGASGAPGAVRPSHLPGVVESIASSTSREGKHRCSREKIIFWSIIRGRGALQRRIILVSTYFPHYLLCCAMRYRLTCLLVCEACLRVRQIERNVSQSFMRGRRANKDQSSHFFGNRVDTLLRLVIIPVPPDASLDTASPAFAYAHEYL